ncbi:amino acid/amide ABC transporter ATP-binding protein 2, HAAT family [Variovorax sp. YR266]|uniref:ABC transporter ATP-binding protein n=1 Tax=Variovorax sp. YR266 TaxID=1884386 RepID=UPI0008969F92|nr:ABC transporter ATP-binding protein [Variovorax sp. YR266]SDZ70364.1 amino acid/amide ABC transporter ATP-binding protein 2, HAAT family [Variovorax sp. YR266]
MSEQVSHPPRAALLDIQELVAGYGEDEVLHGISFAVAAGEVVTLVGRNGAGKSTIMRSIIGILPRRRGSVTFHGQQTVGLPPERIARLGMGYVPEERGIFSRLSVAENLQLPAVVAPGGMSVDEIFTLFPNLKGRMDSPGTKLSGGEQQMLAIARVLRTGARFLLLDEPTEGLAPVIVQQIGRTIDKLKEAGFTILLVEQNIHFASTVSDRWVVIEEGHVVDQLPRLQTAEAEARLARYLGI